MMDLTKFRGKIKDLKEAPFPQVSAFLQSKKFKKSPQEIFWQSSLSVKWAKELISLPNAVDLLLDYFSEPKHVNALFLRELVKHNTQLLMRVVKISQAFTVPAHWESFEVFQFHQDQKLRLFFKELTYIKKLLNDWEEKAHFYQGVLAGLPYEDIFIHTVAYFERLKRSEKSISNRSLLTSIDITFCYNLNNLLNIKRTTAPEKTKPERNEYTLSALQKAIQEALPPLNPPEGMVQGKYLPSETISQEKKLLRETIRFYFSFYKTQYLIDRYLCGLANFEIIEEWEATLKTNKRFATHQRNDTKSIFQENLSINQAAQKEEVKHYFSQNESPFVWQNFLAIQSAVEYWSYLKLPSVVSLRSGETVEMRQVFTLLKTFSNYLMPPGRVIIPNEEESEDGKAAEPLILPKYVIPEQFSQLFRSDYLYVVEEEELLKNVVTYFGWELKAVRSLIAFLATDLSSANSSSIDFLTRPLLKIGSRYFWLSSLLRDRRWEVLMHKRLAEDRLNNHQSQTSAMEKALADSFRKAGFNAIASWEYDKGKENEGEIDVLAFKDKVLFVIELKTTYLDENLLRYSWYHAVRLEYKACNQLERHQTYIESHFENIKNIPELAINCELQELKIVPLIVSNIFEMDDLLLRSQYRKISLFELSVILNNDLYDTLHNRLGTFLSGTNMDTPVSSPLKTFNQNNPQFKKGESTTAPKENFNLWSNVESCSPTDLMNAIEGKRVWQGLDEMMDFSSGTTFKVGPFSEDMGAEDVIL